MDFAVAPAIRESLERLVERDDTGYGPMEDEQRLGGAFARRMRDRYGWEVDPELVMSTIDVVQGIVAAIFVLPVSRLIMGPMPGLTFGNVPLLLLITILSGGAFAALGLFLGTAIAPQQVGLIFSIVLAPMIMFGCTYFPWAGLERIPVMKWAVLVDPLVYVSEGMRAALTPSLPHMPLAPLAAALLVILALFLWLGLRAFDRRAVS